EPGPRLWAWTYAVSQKVRNLERDARATLQVEAGEQYQELRGVMLECDVAVHRELEAVKALGHEIFARYASPRGEPPVDELPVEVGAMVDKQAVKRVALEFVELRRASWDHRKLGGTY
ncbi:MAG TPA: pyridoxamine 5'-phosphate oxidase, partial [Solirubrobacteraceae bacterium]|nr:pyridoxamine 5'-phosphate oxidase [Solirubrobacteraceae bacterium]